MEQDGTPAEKKYSFSVTIPTPGPSNIGKGITRQREVDDEGADEDLPVKRQRRGE